MNQSMTHHEHLAALKRIEGQIRGIQRMIERKEYCIDIVNQIHASINALYRVTEKIFIKHIEHCALDAFRAQSESEMRQKVDEILAVIKKLHIM